MNNSSNEDRPFGRSMPRIILGIPGSLLQAIDEEAERATAPGETPNRSQMIRDLIRDGLRLRRERAV